jgi:hypothetical protein
MTRKLKSESERFAQWRNTADLIMSDVYGIDTEDAGLDDEWLKSHWSSGDTPQGFVEWFGRKYDLTSKRDAGIEGW